MPSQCRVIIHIVVGGREEASDQKFENGVTANTAYMQDLLQSREWLEADF